jgi:hypothetical protein
MAAKDDEEPVSKRFDNLNDLLATKCGAIPPLIVRRNKGECCKSLVVIGDVSRVQVLLKREKQELGLARTHKLVLLRNRVQSPEDRKKTIARGRSLDKNAVGLGNKRGARYGRRATKGAHIKRRIVLTGREQDNAPVALGGTILCRRIMGTGERPDSRKGGRFNSGDRLRALD